MNPSGRIYLSLLLCTRILTPQEPGAFEREVLSFPPSPAFLFMENSFKCLCLMSHDYSSTPVSEKKKNYRKERESEEMVAREIRNE